MNFSRHKSNLISMKMLIVDKKVHFNIIGLFSKHEKLLLIKKANKNNI